MLEVLIAMLILTVILLGVAKYQLDSLKYIRNSYLNSVALRQINNFFDRLMLSSTDSIRAQEYNRWNQNNLELLPQGHGTYQCHPVTHQCTVTLRWQLKSPHVLTLSKVVR